MDKSSIKLFLKLWVVKTNHEIQDVYTVSAIVKTAYDICSSAIFIHVKFNITPNMTKVYRGAFPDNGVS